MLTSLLENTMAEEQEDTYKHLKDYEKKRKIAEDMVKMTERTHRAAWDAYEAHFISDEGRGVDLEKAKDAELRKKALKDMKEVYIKKAKEVLKASPADEFEEALLMRAYTGATEAQLKQMTSQYKDKLNFDLFQEHYKKEFMKQIGHDLRSAASSHIGEEHIDDIIKYTGVDKYGVDSSRLRLPEALDILEDFRKSGAIGPKGIPEEFKKKKEKKEDEEELPKAA